MSSSISNQKAWSNWHEKLHKTLITNQKLLPNGACLLLAVSGGQDSMALLRLMLDLRRLHGWKLHVWHGDHSWHNQSAKTAKELASWCDKEGLICHTSKAAQSEVSKEATARNWRYKELCQIAETISLKEPTSPCNYVLTGHTGSDRAETFLLNLARGADLAGLSSLKEARFLSDEIQLIRPLLCFSRNETAQICKDLNLPIWTDPSNKNLDLSRNMIREKIIPVLEDLYPNASMRIASLADRIAHYKEDQQAMSTVVIEVFKHPQGLCRRSLSKLSLTARATIIANWLQEKDAPSISSRQIKEISKSIEVQNPPGSRDLAKGWKISWVRESIQLRQTQNSLQMKNHALEP